MPSSQNSISILFADIVGSTRLFEVLGDIGAREITAQVIAILSEVTHAHGGTVVKTIGDEVMTTFISAKQAVEAACQMHSQIKQAVDSNRIKARNISIKIGFHHGPVIHEGKDVFGDAVNVAARMVGLAKQDQILTTEQTVQLIAPSEQRVRFVDRTSVKGKREAVSIYEIFQEEEEAELTLMSTSPLVAQIRTEQRMEVQFQDIQTNINELNSSITMGRGLQNDIVVPLPSASRLHARLELRRGKFVLIDQSTNGTYILPTQGDPVHLHRDEFVLLSQGVIGLGIAVTNDSSHALYYQSHEMVVEE